MHISQFCIDATYCQYGDLQGELLSKLLSKFHDRRTAVCVNQVKVKRICQMKVIA